MPIINPYESSSLTDILTDSLCGLTPSGLKGGDDKARANSHMHATIVEATGKHSSMPSQISTQENRNSLRVVRSKKHSKRALRPGSITYPQQLGPRLSDPWVERAGREAALSSRLKSLQSVQVC
jgi:hypothetical protein